MRGKILGILFIVAALVMLFSLVVASPVSADSGNHLYVSKWAENVSPIYDPVAKAYYPTIVKISDTEYHMWYGSDSGVGYAISSDGLTWIEQANPVIGLTNANHPLVEYFADGFTGINSGNNPSDLPMCYRIWYWPGLSYSINDIRYAESSDGINWFNDQPLIGNIISGTAGEWNRGSYGAIDVIYNPSAANTGTNPFDYSYAMYFDATTGGFESIGLGYSMDGIVWALYGEVLPRGNDGAWDSNYTTFGTILKEPDGTWHMWYSGGQKDSNDGIGHAYSSDGLTWVRDTSNPLVHQNDGVSYRSERTYTPVVIKDGGVYRMWFSAKDTGGNYAIGYATSSGTFTSIQSAIDAATAGDTIDVAAGTYNENINIDKNLTITGDPDNKPVVFPAQDTGADNVIGPTGRGWFQITGGAAVTIKNIVFDGTGHLVYTAIHFHADSNGGIVENCDIRNIAYTLASYQGRGINNYGQYVEVLNCTFTNIYRIGVFTYNPSASTLIHGCTYNGKGDGDWLDYGIEAGNGAHITAEDNIINGCTGVALVDGSTSAGILVTTYFGTGTTATITGNTLTGNTDGIAVGYDETDASVVIAHRNNLSGNEHGIYSTAPEVNAIKNWWGVTTGDQIAATMIEGPVSYDPWYSDAAMTTLASDKPVHNVTQDMYYDTIQAAINAATANNIINVAAGTYNENIIIDEAVTLLGAQHDVDPAGSTDRGGESIITGYVEITAGATFNGFKLDENRIWIHGADGATVSYNILEDVTTTDGTITNYQAVETYIGYNTISGTIGVGIMTIESDDVTIEYNYILDCTKAGIEAVNHIGTGIVISHNTITNPGEKGVNYWAEPGGIISYNTITGSNWEGIFTDTPETQILHNILHNCHNNRLGDGDPDYASIHLEATATGSIVDGNTVSDGFKGIQTWANNTVITNNEIYDMGKTYPSEIVIDSHTNKNAAILIGNIWPNNDYFDPTGIVIEKNNIHDNCWGLFYKAGLTNGVNAIGNWWGSASGPACASNPGATGDAISDNVLYSGWLATKAGTGPMTFNVNNSSASSIQDTIDIASDGDIINLLAGTYDQNIDINKMITFQGAGSDVTGTVLQNTISPILVNGSPYSYKPVVIISSSGIDGSPILLKDLMIRPRQDLVTGAGYLPGILLRPGSSISHLELNNVHIVGTQSPEIAEAGIVLDDNTSLDHVVIGNCEFRDMAYGIIFYNNSNTGTMAQNIEISNTTFNNNSCKGFYAEKLSDTTFTNVFVTNNGNTSLTPDWADQYNAGIDINLKYGDYVNIVFNNMTVTGNGIGSANGAGITIKARGTGSDTGGSDPKYNTRPATLNGVAIDGGTFNGNEAGIRFGEPGMDNTSPINITVHNATITGNTQFGLSNVLAAGLNVDATNNYWGSASGPNHNGNKYNINSQGSVVIGAVNYTPWLKTEGGASFAPVTNANSGNQYSSIQTAITAAASGNTITVEPGIFTERIIINQPLTLLGATWNVNKNGYTVPADYAWDTSVESVINNPSGGEYNVVDIYATNDVTFKGFIVQSLNIPAYQNTANLLRVYADAPGTCNNIVVQNNIIGPNLDLSSHDGTLGRMGLYLATPTYTTDGAGITNSTFSGNKIFDCKGNGNNVFVWGAAKFYNSPANADYSGTIIEDNEICGSHRSGIEIAGGVSNLIIRNNNIWGNSGYEPGDELTQKYGNGIAIIRMGSDWKNPDPMGANNIQITGNNIHDNEKNGIYMGPINTNYIINNNKIYNNGWDAIRLDLTELYDGRNNPAVPVYDIANNIAAHFNRIYNNAGFGVQVIGTPTNGFVLDAINNWWGSSKAEIIATKVNGAVDYDPWHLKAPVQLVVGEVTADSVVLNWTTDGVWSGDYFDFRYATIPILTDADWNNAKRITGEPVPINGAQTMKIRNLNSGKTYYFGFTLADGNYRSEINVANAKTLAVAPVDITAPAPIANLGVAAGTPSTTSVVLTWTATGDDGANGFAAKYIVKRSTKPIDATNFDKATTVYNTLTPKVSGGTETLTITRLTPGVTYYFAIKVQDEVPKTSTISNVVSIQTANVLPTVTSINPATGDNGQLRTLTIEGNNFAGAGTTIVRLVDNQNTLTLKNVNIVDNTHLTADVPKGVPTGTYRVRVTNNNGKSEPSAATYIITAASVPLPVVTNVIPNIAASDTDVDGVEIFGKNFVGATAVTINGHDAAIVSVTATKITVDVPGMSAGEYDVKVTVPAAGTNDVSAVKYVITDPVVITNNSTDTTTSDVVQLTTNNITVQLTLTTDDSENATQNTDVDAEISVTIPPDTMVTDSHGNPYAGTLNPPRVVKPDTTIQSTLSEDAIVIEMGNPDQTINFDQDFVATVRVTGASPPKIYYYNKTSGQYELAGKTGTKDGINYAPGGTVLAVESISDTENLYTIGLLLDHMSVYVASTESLLPTPAAPAPPPGGVGGGGGGSEALVIPPGTTDITELITTAGRFLEDVYAYSEDHQCSIFIPQGTVGLTEDLEPLAQISIVRMTTIPELPVGYGLIGVPYDFGPSGAIFDPSITIKFIFDPTQLSPNTDINNLKLAMYTYNPITGEMEWTVLSNIQIDTETNIISGEASHFTVFAIISPIIHPAEFSLTALSISPVEAGIGESVNISFDITNTGDLAGTYDVTLIINNRVVETGHIELSGHSGQTVTFTVRRDNIGMYKVKIGTLSGQFIVALVSTPSPITTTPAPATTTPAPATTTPASTVTTEPFNWNIIVGIVAAVVVVVIVFLYFWLRRRTA